MPTCTTLFPPKRNISHLHPLQSRQAALTGNTLLGNLPWQGENISIKMRLRDRQAGCETTCQIRLCSSLPSFALISSCCLCLILLLTVFHPHQLILSFFQLNISVCLKCMFEDCAFLAHRNSVHFTQQDVPWVLFLWLIYISWLSYISGFSFVATFTCVPPCNNLCYSFIPSDVQCPPLQVADWRFPQTARDNITGN